MRCTLAFLGRIPLDPQMVISTDSGEPYVMKNPESAVAKAFREVSDNWTGRLQGK